MWSNNYIGIPFKYKGRTEDGLDCWGLARLIYKNEYGITLPSFSSDYEDSDVTRIEELIAQYKEGWESVDSPSEGTAVLFRIMGHESHIGVAVSPTHFIHAREGYDSAIEAFDSPYWKRRIVGHFKYNAKSGAVLNVVPHPLRTERHTVPVPEGTKLDVLAKWILKEYSIAEEIKSKVHIILNGKVVEESKWSSITLKDTDTIEYRAIPTGGNTTRLILTLAVIYVAVVTGQAYAADLATATGMSQAGAQAVITATVSMVGMQAVNMIAPIRPPDMGPDPKDPGSAERALMVNGAYNRGTPYQAIPVVLGKVRVTPPLGASNYLTYETERDNYLSMLLVWGYGPLTIYNDSFRIGEQPLTNYTDYQLVNFDRKTTNTYEEMAAFNAIYGNDITQVNPRLELVCDGNPETTVTAGPWAEAISTEQVDYVTIAIHFPQGLRKIKSKGDGAGNSYAASVTFNLEIFYDNAWHSLSNIVVGGDAPKKDAFTYTRTVYNDQFPYGNNGLMIRVRRITGDNTEDNPDYRYYHQAYLQTVTFTRNASPAVDPNNCKIAKSAFKIKATDQLNGSIEGINAIVQTYAKDWNGSAWVLNSTNNPASLFRYVLEHPANSQKITNTNKFDLVQLQHWHAYCAAKGFTFNSVLGTQKSLLEVLRDICAAGRASPALVDGKWTVTIDEEKPNVIQHFTPHNSWGFESSKALPRIPDGLRVTYFDEDQNYQESEIIVYVTGKNSSNAAIFESIQLPGVTKKSSVIDHARWHLAQAKLRPETYTLNTDIEYLVCNRGDRVKVAHDIPMWGVGSGRIKNRISNVVFELDEPQEYSAAKNYLIRVRSSDGSSVVRNITPTVTITDYGTTDNVSTLVFDNTGHPFTVGDKLSATFQTEYESYINFHLTVKSITANSISYDNIEADDPYEGATGTVSFRDGLIHKVKLTTTATEQEINSSDLFIFGEVSSDSQDLIVLSIEPTTNKSARITMIDYGVTPTYNIFTDYLTLTENVVFESQITLPAKLQQDSFKPEQIPFVTKLVSDESVMEKIAAGVFKYNLKVSYSNATKLPKSTNMVQLQYDLAAATDTLNSKFITTAFMNGSITVPDVTEGESYKVRVRYISTDNKAGVWSGWTTTTIVGKTTRPSVVTNFSATPDVATGKLVLTWDNNTEVDIKGYEVRTQNADWGSNANQVFYGSANTCTVLPEDHTERTFYIRAFDYGNNYSETSATITYLAPVPTKATNLRYSYGTTSNTNSTVTFIWDAAVGSFFNIKEYVVTVSRPDVPDEIVTTASNSLITRADWLGNAVLSIQSKDVANSLSEAATLTVPKYAPSALLSLATEVVDNNVLLRWELPPTTSLPVSHVDIRRGATWETADKSIGTKNGTFTTVFELSGGRYTYWIATVDTDNRYSEPTAVSVTVAQPPDFVFNAEYTSTFSGTRTNAANVVNSSNLLLLVNTSETWEQHYSNNSWTSPQEQITAGYTYYSLPALSTATYQEVFDYGTILASSSITVSKLGTVISGFPTVYSEIETSLDGSTWTTAQAVDTMFAFNFRYIRITINATANTDKDLYLLTNLVVRLDNKQKSDSGNVTAVNTDTYGTIVNFAKEFTDIQSINLTPAGTTPISAVYDFKDAVLAGTYSISSEVCTVNVTDHGLITGQTVRLTFLTGSATNGIYTVTKITDNQYTVSIADAVDTSGNLSTYAQSMRVYAFNSTTGTRTSAQVSWQIRGY